MALVKWRPARLWNPVTDLQDEINRLFDLTSGRRYGPGEDILPWSPALDVVEKDNETVVKADLPGMKEDEIDVSVEGDLLTIKGERKAEKEEKEKGYYCCERSYGSFRRTITLPHNIDPKKVKASYKGGVLEIHLPKAPGAKSSRIKIEGEK